MDAFQIIIAIIAGSSGLATILLGLSAYKRTLNRDAYESGDQEGSLKGDIKYTRNIIDDLRIEFKNLRLDIKEVAQKQDSQNERIIRVEENVKLAHKRLDRFEVIKKGGDKADV